MTSALPVFEWNLNILYAHKQIVFDNNFVIIFIEIGKWITVIQQYYVMENYVKGSDNLF